MMDNPQNWPAENPPEYEHRQHERTRRVPIYVPAPVANRQDSPGEGKRISWPRVIGLALFLVIAIVLVINLLGSIWTSDSAEGSALTQYLKPEDLRFLNLILVGIGLGLLTGGLVRLLRKI